MSGKTLLSKCIVRPPGRAAKFQRTNPEDSKGSSAFSGRREKGHYAPKASLNKGLQSPREKWELFRPAAEQKRAVGAAEPEGVRHGIFDFRFAGLIGNQVDTRGIRIGIRLLAGRAQTRIAK